MDSGFHIFPVAILIPFIGWGVYIMGLIQAEFDNLGVMESDYTTFVQAIPFQLYAILAIIMIPLVAFTHKDFSLMKKRNRRQLLRIILSMNHYRSMKERRMAIRSKTQSPSW